MPDAFIYDHVRTPRGRGKADGALHEVTALNLAAQALAAIKDAQQARYRAGRRRRARLRRSGGRGRRRHRARGGDRRRLRQRGAGRADQPLLRLGPRRGEFRRRAGDVRPARHGGRRRRRIHEPRRHRRLGRRLAGRSVDRAQILFHAAGHLRRPDRDQIRLLARAMRRICGREPEAHGGGLGGRPLRALGGAGEGRRTASPSWRSDEHPAARHQHAVAGARSSRRSCRWASSAASTRSRCRRIPRSSSSSMCITPAIRPASSMAPPRCWSAAARPAAPPSSSRAPRSGPSPISAPIRR